MNVKGENIILRSLEESDLDFLYNIENNKENWKYGSERQYFNRKDLLDYIRKAKTTIKIAQQYRFVIIFNMVPIGLIDLFDYISDQANVGIIIKKKYRRKGYGKEALELLVNYSFNILGVKTLFAMIEINNHASIYLFKTCDFYLKQQKDNFQIFSKLAN